MGRIRRWAAVAAAFGVAALVAWGAWAWVVAAPVRATATPQPRVMPAGETFTFLAWSDQHVTPQGDVADLDAAVDAMNGIAGLAFPPDAGGVVDRPVMVLGTGDCTDWPTRRALAAYARLTARLDYPCYNLAGNHDEGDSIDDSRVAAWITARHGGTSYTFDVGGVRFICLFSAYHRQQQISDAALAYLREQVAAAGPGRPIIVATHYGFAAIGNKDAFVDALGEANVLLVLGGHYHQAVASQYRGRQFLQLPSPRQTGQFVVIRVSDQKVLARTYDYREKAWSDLPRTKVGKTVEPAEQR